MKLAMQARRAGAALAMLGSAVACGTIDGDDESVVLVLAASSLTDAFTDIETAFEAANDDVEVEMSFAASSAIRLQVEEGAPAGVVALANETLMEALVDAELATAPTVFATNALTIAVPAGNPADVTSIDDFGDPSLLLGACAPQVPCGSYALEVFAIAGVEPALDTEAPDVRSLVAKVAAGELDAALVYTTDVAAQSDAVEAIELPAADRITARYSIAVTDAGTDSRRFVDFVRSDEGRRILSTAGFELP